MPRRRSAASTDMMSLPSTEITPSLGSIIRLIIRRDVVLPQPDGPTKTVILPASTLRSSESTATVPSGKRLVTPRNSIIRGTSVFADDLLPVAAGRTRLSRRTDNGDRRDLSVTGRRADDPLAQKALAQVRCGQWLGEQPALEGVHPEPAQHLELLGGLHAL